MWRLSGVRRVEAESSATCGGWVECDVWRLSGVRRVEAESSATCGG